MGRGSSISSEASAARLPPHSLASSRISLDSTSRVFCASPCTLRVAAEPSPSASAPLLTRVLMPLQARAMVSISSRRSGLIRFLSRCRETRNWESVMRFMAGYSMRMPGRIITGQPTGRIAMPKLFAVVLLALAPIASAPAADSDVLGSILNARVIDLSHTWDESSPIASVNPPYAFDLAATHANTRGTFGDGDQLSFSSEVMHWSGQHGAPSIDAIGHIGRDGRLFGWVDGGA